MRTVNQTEKAISLPRKNLHLIYDIVYGTNEDYKVHLPDLREPMKALGYEIEEIFVTSNDFSEKTAHIPPNDPNHLLFLHVDMPQNVPVGSKLESVRCVSVRNFKKNNARYIDILSKTLNSSLVLVRFIVRFRFGFTSILCFKRLIDLRNLL